MRRDVQSTLINAAIAVLSLILLAFIFSFSNRQTRHGVPIEVQFPEHPDQPQLAVEIYQQNPVLDIEVEVLNGCGEPGLAAQLSKFLRHHQVDVVRAENADHFNYPATLLILRNENYESLKHVAAALEIDVNDAERVLKNYDLDLDVDLTLIIGKDFNSILPTDEL